MTNNSEVAGQARQELPRRTSESDPVTHEQARGAWRTYHNKVFNGDKLYLSIQRDPKDVDIVLNDYIDQQTSRDAEAGLSSLKEENERLKANYLHTDECWKRAEEARYAADLELSKLRAKPAKD